MSHKPYFQNIFTPTLALYMRKLPLITSLATLGVLSICWMVFPHWLTGVISFFSIFIAIYIGHAIDSTTKTKSIPVDNYELLRKPIPEELYGKICGKTIAQAIENGLITDLGDKDGNFLFYYINDERVPHAIIQGYQILISEHLAGVYEKDFEIISELRFGFDRKNRYTLVHLDYL